MNITRTTQSTGTRGKELGRVQIESNLKAAEEKLDTVIMKDEYEQFCNRRNSKGQGNFYPLMGMMLGLGGGVALASTALSGNIPASLGAFVAGPVLGLAGGVAIERSAQSSYMERFNSQKEAAQTEIDHWRSELNALTSEEGIIAS